MKKKTNQKGFTLVEILIVVVILAILAGLIIPRFLSQPEKAYIAESSQILGALRRGYLNAMDLGATPPDISSAGMTSTVSSIGLSNIGMQPLDNQNNWTFSCSSLGACNATRTALGGATYSTKVISMAANGTWACGTPYKPVSSSDASKGCTV